MKTRHILSIIAVFALAVLVLTLNQKKKNDEKSLPEPTLPDEESQTAYHYLRWKYEADMIKDPVTGNVPYGLREQEIEFARQIPERFKTSGLARTNIQNNYIPAGPNNIGGRTRALAYDVRYNGTSNRVIISGSVSGGIYRTTDGGNTWNRVSPLNEVHNVSCVAQDPRIGSQDIWYAGGGEYVGNSADATGAGYLSHGLFKSTDNGATWTRLPLNNITDINNSAVPVGVAERFDHPFDYVHKIVVNPVNGDVYVAGHRRVMRSKNGGTTFETVFGSTQASFAANGQSDVIVSPSGKVYIAYNGSAPDLSLRGVWTSASGDRNSFTRIAGGSVLGTDSVAGWRGNAYTFTVVGTENFYDTRRILLGMAMSLANEHILYVLYENGLNNRSPSFDKEADLFKLDMSAGNTWTNLSANLPDFPGGNHEATDPFAIQNGYDLFITVKPNDPNFVLLGGTSLYRSTNGFANTSSTSWIGGYGNTLPTLSFYANSHPDIHNVVFSPNPATPNEVICANDGGLQITSDITTGGSGVVWNNLNNYQTLQYYRVTLDPDSAVNNFAGGAQDNGTHFRDKNGIAGSIPADSNNHKRMVGGDGASVGISRRFGTVQYLYGGVQLGSLRRGQITSTFNATEIRPNGLTPSSTGSTTEFGEFVTNFKLNPDNTEDLFYVNFNRLFRTVNAALVSSTSGWLELTGVGSAVNASNGTNIAIRAMAMTRGTYNASHVMYIGTTDGRIFRIDNPRTFPTGSAPVEITPTGAISISGLNVQDIAVNPNNDNEILVAITNYGRTVGNQFQNVTNLLWTNNAKSATPDWKIAEGNLAGTLTTGFISARSCMIVAKKDASNNPVMEYYVGTSAGLFAVENLGTTLNANGTPNWQREGASVLNYSVINSLAYRPSDNVMVVGTHGNGMYYTFLGTPNRVTGINDPVINDKNFIAQVFPTINSEVVQYRIGNKPEVKSISIQLYNFSGQELMRLNTAYTNGSVNLGHMPKGAYILSIYSDNRKYRHIQKIIR